MMELNCLIVGEQNTFNIKNVDERIKVSDLARLIQKDIKHSGAKKIQHYSKQSYIMQPRGKSRITTFTCQIVKTT
jgi:hypothetical protein